MCVCLSGSLVAAAPWCLLLSLDTKQQFTFAKNLFLLVVTLYLFRYKFGRLCRMLSSCVPNSPPLSTRPKRSSLGVPHADPGDNVRVPYSLYVLCSPIQQVFTSSKVWNSSLRHPDGLCSMAAAQFSTINSSVYIDKKPAVSCRHLYWIHAKRSVILFRSDPKSAFFPCPAKSSLLSQH